MKKNFILAALLVTTACKPEISLKHTDESLKHTLCYDVINITNGQPNGPILIDKCTGETWMALKITEEKKSDELSPSFTLAWYRIGRSDDLNTVAGLKRNWK